MTKINYKLLYRSHYILFLYQRQSLQSSPVGSFSRIAQGRLDSLHGVQLELQKSRAELIGGVCRVQNQSERDRQTLRVHAAQMSGRRQQLRRTRESLLEQEHVEDAMSLLDHKRVLAQVLAVRHGKRPQALLSQRFFQLYELAQNAHHQINRHERQKQQQ